MRYAVVRLSERMDGYKHVWEIGRYDGLRAARAVRDDHVERAAARYERFAAPTGGRPGIAPAPGGGIAVSLYAGDGTLELTDVFVIRPA